MREPDRQGGPRQLRLFVTLAERDLRAALAKSVWATTRGSWYQLADGTITNNWPHGTIRYRRLLRKADLGAYATE